MSEIGAAGILDGRTLRGIPLLVTSEPSRSSMREEQLFTKRSWVLIAESAAAAWASDSRGSEGMAAE